MAQTNANKNTLNFEQKMWQTADKLRGEVAGNARKELEEKTGESVISEDNFLDMPEKLKKKRKRIIEQVNIV